VGAVSFARRRWERCRSHVDGACGVVRTSTVGAVSFARRRGLRCRRRTSPAPHVRMSTACVVRRWP